MKSTYLVRLMSLFMALALWTGCSKDGQLVPNPGSDADIMVKAPPIYTGGHIKGQLYPAPDYALIKVFNDEFSVSSPVTTDGYFRVVFVPEGVYTIGITYEIENGDVTYHGTLEIDRVGVKGGEVTEMGLINIPLIL